MHVWEYLPNNSRKYKTKTSKPKKAQKLFGNDNKYLTEIPTSTEIY